MILTNMGLFTSQNPERLARNIYQSSPADQSVKTVLVLPWMYKANMYLLHCPHILIFTFDNHNLLLYLLTLPDLKVQYHVLCGQTWHFGQFRILTDPSRLSLSVSPNIHNGTVLFFIYQFFLLTLFFFFFVILFIYSAEPVCKRGR